MSLPNIPKPPNDRSPSDSGKKSEGASPAIAHRNQTEQKVADALKKK